MGDFRSDTSLIVDWVLYYYVNLRNFCGEKLYSFVGLWRPSATLVRAPAEK